MAINLKNVKVNVPQVKIEDYFWVLAGIPKAGKTSLFAKLTEEYFGDISKSLLLAFEKGYQALRVQAVDINEWDDVEEAVDQLVDDKDELGIEFVGIDTADIMWEMAQASVIEEWNRKNPNKRTNDIGGVGAKGTSTQGFGLGYNLAKQKVRGVIDRLQKAGYGIMVLTHSKDKKVEQRDGEEYDQLSLSLPSSAREIFVNAADFIMFITIEKEKSGKEVETKRYMYFRTDGYVEAGSRFTNVPEKIEYDVHGLLDVFKTAVTSEFESKEDMKEAEKVQAAEKEQRVQEYIEQRKNAVTPNDLIAQLEEKLNDMEKSKKLKLAKKFKEIGGSIDFKTFDSVEMLQQCLDAVNEI
ncbi:ATP-binding protein [Paenibacillus alvei]|uniref:AAA family ATPase n=1 Tax=Paenibacillus alvei TaxID=44250 RepID=UPI002282FFC5|nr:AAA family ATPase [Paenibacillus alvei]MCY9737545.1 ATP-binding protein [Paenibacillus alvei]